ncbi:flagellar motor protein MotA [Rhodovarius crocodyli]|uniref:Flagellar motor protein MotA n=1 Tax=Rhodovarius crocodyli TaxID=1979269 RepID=A0A437MCI5_9PROT|nr:flagellar motor protein MotA [Rhodovarius crocodyli]RVT95359.1 flagellar motor protein MotA [Rhodovarius crocodyli]
MTRPSRYLWRMLIFLAAVVGLSVLLHGELLHAFNANPLLNGLILAVLLLGVGWNIRQVVQLNPEVDWLEAFQGSRKGAPATQSPRLLSPMASMFAARRSDRLSLSTTAMRTVLDGISSRLDESRDLSRYATGLLIFLGLLGTFWGLLLTISSVASVIADMNVGGGDVNALFNQLKAGLAQPLQGMSTAFSSSMLGLAGALVLGFLDLTAGQAQNRFYTDLEEWLASLTRLSSGVLGNDAEGGSIPAYVQALLEQTAENLEGLQTIMSRGEDGRAATSHAIAQLAERMSVLTDQMRATQMLLERVAEQNGMMTPALARLAEGAGRPMIDDGARGHLRNTELLLARLLEDTAQGRAHATAELRNEIRMLTRTIAALSEDGRA